MDDKPAPMTLREILRRSYTAKIIELGAGTIAVGGCRLSDSDTHALSFQRIPAKGGAT